MTEGELQVVVIHGRVFLPQGYCCKVGGYSERKEVKF